MNTLLPKLLSGIGILVFGVSSALAQTEAGNTASFPPQVLKAEPYIEKVPDADYPHASAAAYQAFRAIKYGVRIHWGIYSLLPAARESWTFLGMTDAERASYEQLYRQWDPQGFDAEGWMNFFDRAGFRCFAITTKHHEGFSLWDTKTRVRERINWTAPGGPAIEDCDFAYSVMDTPFKRDIIKELCDAAHRHDIKIDLYFSHPDWYDADFRPFGAHPLQTAGSTDIKKLEKVQGRPAVLYPAPTPGERARMMARHREQLRELLSNYGKIDMVCLDIKLDGSVWPELKETIKELRRLQPDVMLRDRGIGSYGDYYTPERVVPSDKTANGKPWMVIYPLGTNFSWEGDATKYKGAQWVVDNLADTVAKGGSFMVGIGPDGNGRFHPTAIAQLEEVGAWLKINGEGIFGTHARPGNLWKEGDAVRFTEGDEGKFVYAILLKRPGDSVALSSVQPRAGSTITLLGQKGELPWRPSPNGVQIDFPAESKASLAYVLKIEAQPAPLPSS